MSISKAKRVQWQPKSGSTAFLVGGTELRLYEWIPPDAAESKVVFRTLALNGDSTLMKCYAWSPNPNIENLVAIGYSTGKTSLVQFSSDSRTGLARSSSSIIARIPSTSSITAQQSPSSSLSSAANMLTSHVLADFTTRNSRACNAVAFCSTDYRFLASGLDKVRSDHCLFVWDTTIATTSVATPVWKGRPDLGKESPIQRSSSASSVTSLTESTAHTRNTGALESNCVAQYGIGDSVSSLDWLSMGSPRIVAGMGAKIRIFDLKAPSHMPPISINTKAVHGVAADPFHTYRFASYDIDGTIRLWDCRKPTEAALTFPSDDKSGIIFMSWSPFRQGMLASLGRDSSVIKIWNIQEGPPREAPLSSYADDPGSRSGSVGISGIGPALASPSIPGSASPDLLDSPNGRGVEQFPEELLPSSPMLWRLRTVKSITGAPAGFSWMPFSTESDFSQRMIVAYNKEPMFEIVHLQETLKLAWAPQGQLATTAGKSICMVNPSVKLESIRNGSDETVNRIANKLFDNDISVLMRCRARAGYGMDTKKNFEVVENSSLKELWALVLDAQNRVAANGTVLEKTDYSFKGIANVIDDMAVSLNLVIFGGHVSHQGHSRHSSLPNSPTKSEPSSASAAVSSTYLPFRVYSNPYRKLALIMCGFGLEGDYSDEQNSSSFERRLREMENDREFEKAAGWAFFHASNLSRAVQALNSSRDERLKLVAAAMAGYPNFQFGGSTSLWKDLTESLSRELEGPYLRAMFALMSSNGNWSTVLEGPDHDANGNRGLPIRDRIAIALRYLTDEQLTAYIRKTTQQMRQTGNIEGLLLTGLTSVGVDLFEEYVDCTGDVQSACLVMSLVVPKRFVDVRVDSWVENYRLLLDRWELFHIRAKFDIARRRYMPPEPMGEALVPAQVYSVMIPTCQPAQNNQPRSKVTVCPNPKCGQPLPRCSLCLLALGTVTENLQSFARKADGSTMSGFDTWFTWCSKCRHGGHAGHILDWFDKHNDCPLEDCKCNCLS
ncbi:hypothetical protein SeMB42_g06774 [Synchytrium endobioticum]|uniref:Uncharacterized protein n=1 Tax=Synchytrium endobioticum TaxID=286115 RepID=A0A507CFH9_9FUNG|nr:hypothetical protein SeMB42_g06774 [Synchytrium endobioticum]